MNFRYVFAYNFYKQHLLHVIFHRRNEKNRSFHLIPKTPFRSMNPKVIGSYTFKQLLFKTHWPNLLSLSSDISKSQSWCTPLSYNYKKCEFLFLIFIYPRFYLQINHCKTLGSKYVKYHQVPFSNIAIDIVTITSCNTRVYSVQKK